MASTQPLFLLAVLAASPSVALAAGLQPMSDASLSQVTGQDGIALDFDVQATASQLDITMDGGTPQEAGIRMGNMSVNGIGGGNVSSTLTLDAASTGGVPRLDLSGSWTDVEYKLESITHSSAPTNSLGTIGIRGSGSFTFQGGPLFNESFNNAYFDLTTTDGEIFWRQGAVGTPELSFGNLAFGAGFTDGAGNPGTGTIGLANDGLYVEADFMDFDLNFDLFFTENPGVEFDEVTRQPMILFGWDGGIANASLKLSTGGIGYGSAQAPVTHPDYAAMVTDMNAINPAYGNLVYFNNDGLVVPVNGRSEGLHMVVQWDYDTDFSWILGQAAGDRVRVDFFDWQTLSGAPYDFRLPITIDAINASQGPGGICFGGTLPSAGSLTGGSCTTVGGSFENTAPKNSALAVIMRDGRLHAYNSKVRVTDPGAPLANQVEEFNWSLLYTFGKLDANIYLYPGGFSDYATGTLNTNTTGLAADVLLAIQSPGYWRAAQANFSTAIDSGIDPNADANWATNTHFMIADTSVGGVVGNTFGIGVVNADLLWKADNFRIELWDSTDGYGGFPGLALVTEELGQYRFRGLFGGGALNDLGNPVRLSLLDVNIETDEFAFILSPAEDDPGTPRLEQGVGFDGLFNFNGNAYVSLAEPSNPRAQFVVGDISGRLMWENGVIELTSAAVNADGKPRLTIRNDLTFGSSAAVPGDELRGWIKFGDPAVNPDVNLAQIAIPSGRWYSSISLKKQ